MLNKKIEELHMTGVSAPSSFTFQSVLTKLVPMKSSVEPLSSLSTKGSFRLTYEIKNGGGWRHSSGGGTIEKRWQVFFLLSLLSLRPTSSPLALAPVLLSSISVLWFDPMTRFGRFKL